MSSPKTRAQSSSYVPPAYITGAGVDNHAIEARRPHWFGHVPAEMVELFKNDAEAPLCFQSSSALASHTWVSKNLSCSFPSSEVRNSLVKWADWIDRLFPRYGAHCKRAGIYDAILLFKQSINRDESLLAAALCFWNSGSNTFDFRVGPMAPTLLDMAQIFGFRPHGHPVDAVSDYHRKKNQEKDMDMDQYYSCNNQPELLLQQSTRTAPSPTTLGSSVLRRIWISCICYSSYTG
ncbi:unnamed protein product [Prunus armeniaca]